MGASKETLHKSNSDPVKRTRYHVRSRGSPVSKCFLNLDGYSYVIGECPPPFPEGWLAPRVPHGCQG